MPDIQKLVDSFHQFAIARIADHHGDESIDEIFAAWRRENPTDDEFGENVAAVQASIQDFKNGERGTVAGEHSRQLRGEFGIVDK